MSLLLGLLIFAQSSSHIDSGLILELKTGASFFDQEDSSAALGGARLSYAFSDPTDAFITLEVEATYERTLEDPAMNRFLAGLGIGFYEIYTPYAFRLVAGGLFERRDEKFSPGFSYRFGLGYYWLSSLGTYIDYGNRMISRETETTYTNEVSLSMQFIF